MISLDVQPALSFLAPDALDRLRPETEAAHRMLVRGTGTGADALGWRRLLAEDQSDLLARIAATAGRIRADADVLVCIGIGGSYLGAQAVLDALRPYFAPPDGPEVVFAGHHMSGAYHEALLQHLEGKSVYCCVISKSGTTLEPALAFRLVEGWMRRAYGEAEAARRIIAVTDPESGALRRLADARGYETYVIPPDVGGRFSVLTPVGLVPLAAAGLDVRALVDGAADAFRAYAQAEDNPALTYAAVRRALHDAGYKTELLAVLEPRLRSVGFWWQQLFGESEGKDGKGLFPVSVQYSTDLHSLGQYVQQGQRTLVETFLMADDDGGRLPAPAADDNADGLDYLVGKPFSEINRKAYEGTRDAHVAGGVPAMTVWMPDVSARSLGALFYFFEHAVGVGGYLLGVNPFDQPGVEDYKQRMFRLLGKPGA
jgi:glucose-6-phosphate isomerase